MSASFERVLVTGATGYIGRRLIERLARAGARVRGLALPGEYVSGIEAEIARGDLRLGDGLAAAAAGCELVLHLGALVGDWGPCALFHQINAEGTGRMCRAAAEAGARRVVVVSSVTVYGANLGRRVCREDVEPDDPASPYSRSKVAAEAIARGFAGELEIVVVRPGNVWGPASTLWVETLAAELRRGRVPLIGGGAGDASLAHVDNVIEGLLLAGQSDAAPGRAYNLGDGGGVTWAKYLGDLAAAAGARPPSRSIPAGLAGAAARAMEIAWRLARRRSRPLLTREAARLLAGGPPVPIDRARDELGYRPPISYADGMAAVAASLAGGPGARTRGSGRSRGR